MRAENRAPTAGAAMRLSVTPDHHQLCAGAGGDFVSNRVSDRK